MGIFDKTRYLRALFILLPLGIGFSYFGIDGLARNVNDLPYNQGIISNLKLGAKYSDICDCKLETFFIYINNVSYPFTTTITTDIQKLQKNLKIGDHIEVWTWKTDDAHIEQVKINGEIIVSYDKTVGLYLGLLTVGLSLIVLCVFYIIKSPEDLFGKKKS